MSARLTGLLALVSAASIGAQGSDTLSVGKPRDVGLDARKLEAAARIMHDAVVADDVRGCVLLVARKRKIVLHREYGWRDLGKKHRMRKDTLFRMASNSKAVTAAAVLILAEEKKLALDAAVHRYLPSFGHGFAKEITVRHLLTHTAGLGTALFKRPLLPNTSLQKEVARFGKDGISTKPGSVYRYSNTGYNTLAALVEVVGANGYKKFLKGRIYSPLGMKDSCNHESDADHRRMCAVLRRGKSGGFRSTWKPGDEPDFPIPRGSGGMISTARDYAVFCQMFLNGGAYGGKRILSRAMATSATTAQAEHIRAAKDYGFGWRVRADTFSHSGSDGTIAWVNKRKQLIVLVFTQTKSKKNPRSRFYQAVLAACE